MNQQKCITLTLIIQPLQVLSARVKKNESRRESRWRDFLRQKFSPRVSDRIICMTLGETLSETRFFTPVIINKLSFSFLQRKFTPMTLKRIFIFFCK